MILTFCFLIWCTGYDFTKGITGQEGSWKFFNNWPEQLGKHLGRKK